MRMGDFMKKFGKRPNRGIEYVNEEDVAKALLNKRTEVALYKDLEVKKEEPKPLTRTEIKQAEQSMSSALDLLRKERGQKSIEQEEIEYSFNQKMNEYDLLDDMTSQSVTDKMNLELVRQATMHVKQDLEDTDMNEDKLVLEKTGSNKTGKHKKVSSTSKHKKISDTQKMSKTSKHKKLEQTGKMKKVEPEEKKKSFTVLKIVLTVVLVGFALMGGYAYKLYVYDPQNVVSEQQQEAYDRLIAYADEYDMMSESEKLELLDMQEDYDCLLSKQKSAINDYFKDVNHVGKTYTALIKELQKLKDSLEDESGEAYQSLKAFLEGWPEFDDYSKRMIISYKPYYDSLNTTLQKKIDDIARTNCKKSFMTLYNEYHEVIQSENNAQISINNDRIGELQEQLRTEQKTMDDYKQYGEGLQKDLDRAKEGGYDTTTLEDQIKTNNEAMTQQQQVIDNIQKDIDQLKAENEQLASI